ncbi:hypothetical protein RaK2_00012 [Klebsiella phage vB_KleM_RaK2]|uniref:HNH domain-containing protein n=1 Tax=Klebsiella phage vB_KleM_RaK2 TaxID=1147094 RepID=H6X3G9_9CAUD|nr:HNH endonuclease [Klebsiella phage vB_KleM_RaK2]AFA44285.1 hypothetical protein RaK2_00012 [Klebsiella phage vB_KleM_RaK2]
MNKYKVLKVLPLSFLNSLDHTDIKLKIGHFGGSKFSYYPQKVKTFSKNHKCVACGIEATEVRIEYMHGCSHVIYGKPHINVYAVLGNYSVLMTVDHDILASEGGNDLDNNFSTMCSKCNNKRGSKYKTLKSFLKSIEGRDLLTEYMSVPKKTKTSQNAAEQRLHDEFWELGHNWHYREYLRYLKAKNKAKKKGA